MGYHKSKPRQYAPAATTPTQSMSRHLRGCHHNSLTAVTPKSETPMPKRHSADYATADYANINPSPKRQCRNAAVPITHKPITSSPPAKPTTKSETPNRNAKSQVSTADYANNANSITAKFSPPSFSRI